MSKDLVHQKETVLKGGDNNYWLTEIIDFNNNVIVVEAEDVIEALHMSFALATVFKSIWRLCKLRQGFGKPGSSMLYEAQKVKYYADRSLAITLRHKGYWIGRKMRTLGHLLMGRNIFASVPDVIKIPQPKRLDPYAFDIHDLIASLRPTNVEGEVLYRTLRVAQLRIHPRVQFNREFAELSGLKQMASTLQQREVIAKEREGKP